MGVFNFLTLVLSVCAVCAAVVHVQATLLIAESAKSVAKAVAPKKLFAPTGLGKGIFAAPDNDSEFLRGVRYMLECDTSELREFMRKHMMGEEAARKKLGIEMSDESKTIAEKFIEEQKHLSDDQIRAQAIALYSSSNDKAILQRKNLRKNKRG